MNVLLDECIDRRLALELPGHMVRTTTQMGWAGSKNGALISLAEKDFDALITVDRNLSFQQNLPRFQIAVIVLQAPSNRLADLRPLAPDILASLDVIKPGQAVIVSAQRA